MAVAFVGKHLIEMAQQDCACLCTCIYFHSDCRLCRIGLEMKMLKNIACPSWALSASVVPSLGITGVLRLSMCNVLRLS